MFKEPQQLILSSLGAAHDAYYRTSIFSGPSLHFHLRSLEASNMIDFDLFSELVFAV